MKLSIEFDLTSNEVVLTTPFSNRRFSVKRQLNCRECGVVNKNPLVEWLRACAIYELAPKERDVSAAVLAYDLEEVLKALGESVPKARVYSERGRARSDGVVVRTLAKKLTFEEMGDLE